HLMSIRSESQTRRNPCSSAATPSPMPWARVRETVSYSVSSCFEATAPAMIQALMSCATGGSADEGAVGVDTGRSHPVANYRRLYGVFGVRRTVGCTVIGCQQIRCFPRLAGDLAPGCPA